MQIEIGGNIPISEEFFEKQANESNIWGCQKFKHNLYTFSARSALEVYLNENYKGEKKVILPIFTCETCITPFINNGFVFEFYSVNKDLSINEESLKEQLEKIQYSGILYIHSYFGFDTLTSIKPFLKQIRQKKNITIIDDYTQSWLNNTKEIEADIYIASLRKWLSTPDGGVISSDDLPICSKNIQSYNKKQAEEYIEASKQKNRFFAGDSSVTKSQFYSLFKHTIEYFEEKKVYAMSPISKAVYDYSDYEFIRHQRIQNAKFLSQNIRDESVERIFKNIPEGVVPLYYPIYVKNNKRDEFQQHLIKNNIFCPIHWTPSTSVTRQGGDKNIYPDILSLVCDQRYGIDDMERMVNVINNFR
jgi:hypothetical protein